MIRAIGMVSQGWRGWSVPTLAAFAVLVLASSAAPSFAQPAQEAADNMTTVIERFEPPPRRPPSVGVTVDADVLGIPAGQLDTIRFRLTAIDLVGAESVPTDQLAALWRGMIGREISLADLRDVLDGIAEVYRQNDYYGLAIAPPQDFSDGRIEVRVYEAYIREVVIVGDYPGLAERLDPYIARIVAMDPVRISRLERYLLLMADLAGVTIDALLSKIPDEPGAGKLELTVGFDRQVIAGRVDNFGNDETGPLTASMTARFNDLFGQFEGTDFLAVTNPLEPDELVFLRLSQIYQLGPSGFAAGYEIGQVWSDPGGDLAALDVHAETTIGKVHLDYAFMRRIQRSLIGSLALNTKNVAVDIGELPATREYNRWVTAGATYDDVIAGAALIIEVAVAQGLDDLGSTGEDADFRFVSFDGSLGRDLTETVTAGLRFTGQKALTPLPSAVKFDVGGENYGRAFDGGTITGEDGVAAALEIGKRIDTGVAWLQGFTIFAFGDYGAVWNDPGVAPYEFAALGSYGGGIRSRLGRHGSVAAYVAAPWINTAKGTDPGVRFRFTAGVRY